MGVVCLFQVSYRTMRRAAVQIPLSVHTWLYLMFVMHLYHWLRGKMMMMIIIIVINNVLINVTLSCQRYCRGTVQI